ncbi:MAG TPA: radical SAM family heme chaperone HemW [Thermodesulfovibrionales bacterium]|nr:radical SAM family heme chaperone HemW [Thermodesulfovibrionales bacterium]
MTNCLYIHIPFCVKKCIYCDFLSVPYDNALAMNYVSSITKELELRKHTARTLKSVYIGGGTPTTVPTPDLIRILRKIKDSFDIAPDAEITIEANPGTTGKETFTALYESGINRISLGAQSFNEDELKLLGRIHDSSDALRSIVGARHAGITNISIDLIYGIPGQTLDAWSHTVSEAIEISPEHISAYELTIEDGTPLHKLIAKGEMEKPDEEIIVDMYYHAIDRFAKAGYGQYEISNFARPGFECRHNLNYWNRGQYIGVGAAAHSFIENERTRNTDDIEKYIRATQGGKLAVEENNVISPADAAKELIFLGLRKTEGLKIAECRNILGIDIAKTSKDLIAEGLLVSDSGRLRLTKKGIVVSTSVIAELLEGMEVTA